MQKERAASALQRGLPVPTPLPKRAPTSALPRIRSNESPPGSRGSESLGPPATRQGLPLAVKLFGLGLGLLGLVYGLTLFRDHRAAVPANITGASVK